MSLFYGLKPVTMYISVITGRIETPFNEDDVQTDQCIAVVFSIAFSS